MAEKSVVTYEAIAADILDNGAGRPAALIILAAGQQRVVIRMEPHAVARLRWRIDATFPRGGASRGR